jgi:hypothetical protein
MGRLGERETEIFDFGLQNVESESGLLPGGSA